jgi:effector-binding domain-containing protein
MIEPPVVTETAGQLTASIHLTIPRHEIQTAMGPGIGEVMAAVAAQGVGPAGPWFTHHHAMDPAVFDFDICVPVTAPVVAVGRVVPGEIPALRVARTIYHGSFEGLGGAWQEFKDWIAANSHSARPDLIERYLVGPESSPDPANWRTELNQPLRP